MQRKPQKPTKSDDVDDTEGDYIVGYNKLGVSKDLLPVSKSSN